MRTAPITAVAPLPFPRQQPDDDLAMSMSLIRIAYAVIERSAGFGGLDAAECLDVLVALDKAQDGLRPILKLLAGADFPGMMDRYRAARIETINVKG